MSQLKPLPPTTIRPHNHPPKQRQKWLICDDDGSPITAVAGSYGPSQYSGYRESSEEKAMLLELKREHRGSVVVSRPDLLTEGQQVRFEVHTETALPQQPQTPAPGFGAGQEELF